MKVGIITHPLRSNYGGVLQNYALQRAIKKIGHIPITVDWQDDKGYFYMVLSYIKRNFYHYFLGYRDIPTHFYVNLTRKQFLYINQNIQEFISKHIQLSDYIPSLSQLDRTNLMGFDCVVVGSDQVWNSQFAPTLYLGFLDLKIKRFAYAASFGHAEWKYSSKQTNESKRLIRNFQSVSVREDSAVDLCEKYLEYRPELVLDPTMLLASSEYDALLESYKSPNISPYVMAYILDENKYKSDLISYICNSRSLNIFETKPRAKQLLNSRMLDDMVIPSVESWICGIRNSDFVVTDSFHGMVFSIIYNKQFIVVGNKKRGLARFNSLLSMLGLQGRLINEEDDIIDSYNKLIPIDYHLVNKILERKREESYLFLYNSLRDA